LLVRPVEEEPMKKPKKEFVELTDAELEQTNGGFLMVIALGLLASALDQAAYYYNPYANAGLGAGVGG
jgi:lactobin A/cerein 7B family class IIb bacteriocin